MNTLTKRVRQVKCPHCDFIGPDMSGTRKFHFNNCKFNPKHPNYEFNISNSTRCKRCDVRLVAGSLHENTCFRPYRRKRTDVRKRRRSVKNGKCPFCGFTSTENRIQSLHTPYCEFNPDRVERQTHTCEYCNQTGSAVGSFSSYHGPNCRLNPANTEEYALIKDKIIDCPYCEARTYKGSAHLSRCRKAQQE